MDTAVTTNDEHENSRRRATVRHLRLSPTFSSLTGKWIHPLAGVLALATTNVAAKGAAKGAASSVDSPVGRPQGGLGPPPRRHLLALTRGALLRDMGRYGEIWGDMGSTTSRPAGSVLWGWEMGPGTVGVWAARSCGVSRASASALASAAALSASSRPASAASAASRQVASPAPS